MKSAGLTNFSKKEELEWFERYEKVRIWGKYNMYDERAREATGLTEKQYIYVMKNYVRLRQQYKESEEK